MNERKPSCDLELRPEPPQPKTELEETAERMGITPAKLKSMREYAINLRRQNPRMKMSSIRSKVLQNYKIKLV